MPLKHTFRSFYLIKSSLKWLLIMMSFFLMPESFANQIYLAGNDNNSSATSTSPNSSNNAVPNIFSGTTSSTQNNANNSLNSTNPNTTLASNSNQSSPENNPQPKLNNTLEKKDNSLAQNSANNDASNQTMNTDSNQTNPTSNSASLPGDNASVYSEKMHQNWLQHCLNAISSPKVKPYAQDYCECGWSKITSGMIPPAQLLNNSPANMQALSKSLNVIRQECEVQALPKE